VRYGIIADIHGNLPALQQVLEDAATAELDAWLCLGDIVGYGARPNECCEIVQRIGAICIRGNHEQAVLDPAIEDWFNPDARACLIWTREQLTAENLAFLETLQHQAEVNDTVICHGSLPDPDRYISSPLDALPSMQAMPGRLAFFGHTHCAEWFVHPDGAQMPSQHPSPAGGVCEVQVGSRYLVNPGAVGQPRDGNPQAAWALYDDQAQEVHLHRVDYDIALAQAQMRAAGLPLAMHLRLAAGL
jgi:diadenosine tetraphosphatase ApaH/serine/threonine PP2A family protein phosphatase